MAQYSKLAQGTFQSPGQAVVIDLPFTPDYVQIWDLSRINQLFYNNNWYAMWNRFMGPYTSICYQYLTEPLFTVTGVTPGISPVVNGQALLYGPDMPIANINVGSPTKLLFSYNHNLTTGDVVILENIFQSPTTGMQQIAGIPFTVTVNGDTGPTAAYINWNTSTSNYTALVSSTQGCTVNKLISPYLYNPGVLFIANIESLAGATTQISCTTEHFMTIGQTVAFRIPPGWGMYQLNSPFNRFVPSAPIYATVVQIIDSQNLIVNIDSSLFAPFNSNIPFNQYPGLNHPQMVAVGDVNNGSPYTQSQTINAPTISGGFVNNTTQGFYIGNEIVDNASTGLYFYYEARLHDYSYGI